jgi:hypothetical protein
MRDKKMNRNNKAKTIKHKRRRLAEKMARTMLSYSGGRANKIRIIGKGFMLIIRLTSRYPGNYQFA